MIKISNSLSRNAIGLYGDTKDPESFIRDSPTSIMNVMEMGPMHALEPIVYQVAAGVSYAIGVSGGTKIILNTVQPQRNWRLLAADVSWSAAFTGTAVFDIVTFIQIGLNFVMRSLTTSPIQVQVGGGGYAAAFLKDDDWVLIRPTDSIGIMVHNVAGAATPIPSLNVAYINV